MPLPVIDTRPLFRPLCRDIVGVVGSLAADDWMRPTAAGAWRVRDVVAHLIDTALRRLSFHRDRMRPPGRPPATDAELIALINQLNAAWVGAADRLSARVLADLYAHASGELCAFVETLELHDAALFPVSWAGEAQSAQWLDVGREFTEVWHHGAQIRDAVGAGPFADAAWLHAVLEIAMHALPHAYRAVPTRRGASVGVEITGAAGGAWTVVPRADGVPTRNARCSRQSSEKYALSFRSQLRPRSTPFSTRGDVVIGCAVRPWTRTFRRNCCGSSVYAKTFTLWRMSRSDGP